MKNDPVHQRKLISPKMSFEEWLHLNYSTTPEHLEKIALSTGTRKDFDNLITWYKKRYSKQLNNARAIHQISLREYLKTMEDK